MITPDKPGAGVKGEFDGPPPENEAEHFAIYPQCDQALDARDLEQVHHHVTRGHKPEAADA